MSTTALGSTDSLALPPEVPRDRLHRQPLMVICCHGVALWQPANHEHRESHQGQVIGQLGQSSLRRAPDCWGFRAHCRGTSIRGQPDRIAVRVLVRRYRSVHGAPSYRHDQRHGIRPLPRWTRSSALGQDDHNQSLGLRRSRDRHVRQQRTGRHGEWHGHLDERFR